MYGELPCHFEHIIPRGKLMTRRLRQRSDYYTPEEGDFDVVLQSQIGEFYDIAHLGSLEAALLKIKKYDRVHLPLQEKAMQFTESIIFEGLEVFNPVSFSDAYEKLNKGASSGIGARIMGINDRHDPLMKEYVLGYLESAIFNPKTQSFISASQKDELRASKNGKLKDPRIFMAYGPEHTVAATMVFGDFQRQFNTRTFMTHGSVSAVGDALANGAMAFYKQMLLKRPFLYCTDTSGQDATVSPQFLTAFYAAIKKRTNFQTDYDEPLFDNVVYNSINKLVVLAGYLIEIIGGLGSGDLLTININIAWRLYMVVESYSYPLYDFRAKNTVIINGDDLVMSSDYDDLNLGSVHAEIEWAGKPIPIQELDFCSMKFHPDIHHDYDKMMSVLNKRKVGAYQLVPEMEMSRLGGLLLVHVNREFYDEVEGRMVDLANNHGLWKMHDSLWVPYSTVWSNYNEYIRFHSAGFCKHVPLLKTIRSKNAMSNQPKSQKKKSQKPKKKKVVVNRPVASRTASATTRRFLVSSGTRDRGQIGKGITDYGSQMASVVSRGVGGTLRLMPETRNFAQAYFDPFSHAVVRMPVLPVVASVCHHIVYEGTMKCNSNGIGFGLFWPMNLLVNNAACATVSNGPGAPPVISASGTDVATFNSKSVYTLSSFQTPSDSGSGYTARLACWGVRIKNDTININKGGTVYMLQVNPRSTDLTGGDSGRLENYPGMKKYDLSEGKWHQYNRMLSQKMDEDFLYYKSGQGWLTADQTAVTSTGLPVYQFSDEGNPYIALWIQSAANAQFDIEIAGHFEIVGPSENKYTIGVTNPDRSGFDTTVGAGHKLRNLTDSGTKDHAGSTGNSLGKKVMQIISEYGPSMLSNGLKVASMFI